jgi:hypothetical protein
VLATTVLDRFVPRRLIQESKLNTTAVLTAFLCKCETVSLVNNFSCVYIGDALMPRIAGR